MKLQEMKILCLSFWAPPIVRPQSILIGKMIPEWMRQGIRPVILTYDICGDWDINLPVYKIPQFSPNRFLNKIKLTTISEYFYYQKLFKITKDIIEKHQINLVFSFANPQASNILGAMINKKLGIKFISHFSDPWFDNPYKTFSLLGAKKVLFLENFIIKNSNRVIFITEETKQLVMKKYNEKDRQKARIIPHCFDPKDYLEVQKSENKYIFSYIGAFFGDRNPKILFEAFRNLLKNKEISGKFRLKLVGVSLDYARYKTDLNEMIKAYGLEELVELVPAIDYKKSLEYMKTSDCLIVIDANFPNSPFLPSKVVDYAGSGTTIVGITPQNSSTAEFLSKLGYRSFNYSQVNELADYFYKLIRGEIKEEANLCYLNQFNVITTTAKLIKQFEEALEDI